MLHLSHAKRAVLDRAHHPLSFMSHPVTFTTARGPLPDHEQKQAALSYLNEEIGRAHV